MGPAHREESFGKMPPHRQTTVHEIPPDFSSQFDPYPILDRIREAGPIQRAHMPGIGEFWIVTGYDEVLALLTDDRLRAEHQSDESTPAPAADTDNPVAHTLLAVDPPDHTRLRRLVTRAFRVRRIAALRPRIQQLTGELLDTITPAGEGDLVADLAVPLTIGMICELLGVPAVNRADFRRWSVAGVLPPAPPEILRLAEEAQKKLTGYFRDLIEQKRADPQDDLLSDLACAGSGDNALSDTELIGMAILLVIAGHDTTVNLVGTGLMTLLRRPDQLATLRADPSLLPAAVEELVRFCGPIGLGLARFAAGDIEFSGVRIRRGELVMASLAAANRDPARFDRPAVLNVARNELAHLGFGYGIHFCLGAALARLEATVAIGTVLQRIPDLALAKPAEQLRWRTTSLRGVAELPVTFAPQPRPQD